MLKLSKRAVICLLTGVATVAITAGLSARASAADLVVMLLPENVIPRWEQQDGRFFVEAMKTVSPDTKVEVFNANNDPATQQRQAEQALTRGAKVLVVAPIDGQAAAVIADDGKKAGVPVIAYDRMIQSKNTAFWVQADMFATGAAQAQSVVDLTKKGDTLVLLKGSPTDANAVVIAAGQMSVLKPLFASGERVLGYENWTLGWDIAVARNSMDQALTKLNNNVQGVVASNDGNAAAAIASLDEQHMKVPVSGLDCTVQALQLMLLGKQSEFVWRPFKEMGRVTAEITTALLAGKDYASLTKGTVKNAAGGEIPFIPVPFYNAIGEQGVAYVVEHDPSVAKKDVCTGPAAETHFCKG